MGAVAFLANDSGLVIPAFVALVLAPLLVVAAQPRVSESSTSAQPVGAGTLTPA
jgi:hypothetical protein